MRAATGAIVRTFVLLAVVLASRAVLAQEAAAPPARAPLPEPLTLEAALAAAAEDDYSLLRAKAGLLRERALGDASAGRFDTRLSLRLRAQWIGPSDVAQDQSRDDHSASLRASRLLYDFGRGSAEREAATAGLESQRQRILAARDQRRLRVMQAYFQVLLADLETAAATENMTVAFLRYDRLRERNLLGQVSDIELLESEASYQRLRVVRDRAEDRQRSTRARLANSLNRPTRLSANLLAPETGPWELPVPDYEALVAMALSNNPELRAARASLEAARSRLAAARAGDRPRLSAEAEVTEWARVESGSDEWRLTLQLDVPLYSGRVEHSAIDRARAAMQSAAADLGELELQLRESVLEAWQTLNRLGARREAALVQQDFRDLYLDRSRARYELELQSDLGDAMARFSEARVDFADVRYSLILAWETLRALLGIAPGPQWQDQLPATVVEEG